MQDHVCSVVHVLQVASAVFAALAAWRWFVASRGKMPSQATWANIDEVYGVLARQSRLNAHAASFAGVAALLQFFLALLPTNCWNAPWW
jgi:hypothetical protein